MYSVTTSKRLSHQTGYYSALHPIPIILLIFKVGLIISELFTVSRVVILVCHLSLRSPAQNNKTLDCDCADTSALSLNARKPLVGTALREWVD